MKWTAIFLSALLLAGCSTKSVPDLEDVPPNAKASADGQLSGDAQAPGNTPAPDDTQAPTDSGVATQTQAVAGAVAVSLGDDERAAIEQTVRSRLPDPHSARFGVMNAMTARISNFTSQAYVVCGWVDAGGGQANVGHQPFMVMFIPTRKSAFVIEFGDSEPGRNVVRKRCADQGVKLGAG